MSEEVFSVSALSGRLDVEGTALMCYSQPTPLRAIRCAFRIQTSTSIRSILCLERKELSLSSNRLRWSTAHATAM